MEKKNESDKTGYDRGSSGSSPVPPSGEGEKRLGTENLFGRNIMGAVASLLIFIGMVSFAVLVYESISDILKAAGMYLISAGLMAGGILAGKKERTPFSDSLLGCGVGSMYLSILASRVFFMIPGTILYTFLMLWVMGVILIIVRKFGYGNIFCLICRLGVLFSVILARMGAFSIGDYVLVSIYTFICIGVIDFSGKKEGFLHSAGYILSALTLGILAAMDVRGLYAPFHWAMAISIINLLLFAGYLMILLYRLGKWEETSENTGILVFMFTQLCFIFTVYTVLLKVKPESYIGFCLGTILITAITPVFAQYIKLRPSFILSIFLPSVCILALLLPIHTLEETELWFTGYLFLYIPILFSGLRKRSKIYEWSGYLLMLSDVVLASLFMPFLYGKNIGSLQRNLTAATFIMPLIYTGTALFSAYRKREEKKGSIDKLLFYILGNYLIPWIIVLLRIKNPLPYILLLWSVFNSLILSSKFYYKWDCGFRFFTRDTKKYQEDADVFFIPLITASSCFLFIEYMVLWARSVNGPLHILLVLAAAVNTVAGAGELYPAYHKSWWFGPFQGIKATLFLAGLLYSIYDISPYPYLLSTLLILTACFCILAGFIKDIPSLRVYGLVITIAAVLKLVTYDIIELNSMLRVAAFLAGGLLCFGISLIYNFANKKLLEQNTVFRG